MTIRRPSRPPAWVFWSLLLGGCGELDTPGDPLGFFAATPPPAYLDEAYTFDLVVTGGLAPYTFELDSGELPPGLTLENGSISGTPTEAGTFAFSVSVSDASLSRTDDDYSITVTPAPPAVLVLNVPPTTVSDTVRIPISVTGARDLRALRTQVTWDETLFSFVGGSVRSSQGNLALLQRAREGQLSVDLAFLGPTLTGDAELFSLELRPTEPNSLTLSARTEFRTGAGEHGFATTEDSAEVPEDVGDDIDDIDEDIDGDGSGETDTEGEDEGAGEPEDESDSTP